MTRDGRALVGVTVIEVVLSSLLVYVAVRAWTDGGVLVGIFVTLIVWALISMVFACLLSEWKRTRSPRLPRCSICGTRRDPTMGHICGSLYVSPIRISPDYLPTPEEQIVDSFLTSVCAACGDPVKFSEFDGGRSWRCECGRSLIVQLDAGELDVTLVRDSKLNTTTGFEIMFGQDGNR